MKPSVARSISHAAISLPLEQRATIRYCWHDVTTGLTDTYDAIVCNPPFHTHARADRPDIGRRFIGGRGAGIATGRSAVAGRESPSAVRASAGRGLRAGSHRDPAARLQDRRSGEGEARVKLLKLISNIGYGSRKEVTAMFRDGRITDVDGHELAVEDIVEPQRVRIDGEPLDPLAWSRSHAAQTGWLYLLDAGRRLAGLRSVAAAFSPALAHARDRRPSRPRYHRLAADDRRWSAAASDRHAEIAPGEGLRGDAGARPARRRRRHLRRRQADARAGTRTARAGSRSKCSGRATPG